MGRKIMWHSPPPSLALCHERVHVWRASLEQPAGRVEQLVQTLSDDERRRAGRFHFQRHRRRFVVARGALRAILSRYLDIEPGQVRYRYGPHGKPHLAEGLGDGTVQFNLAHSHELALTVLAGNRACGVDLEYLRSIPDAESIAAMFFSVRENATLRSLPTSQREEAFLNYWICKEAYVKARGEGLSQPLDRFEVSLTPGEPVRLLSVDGGTVEAARWSLEVLSPAPGYLAALAVEGSGWHLTCWHHDWPLGDIDEERAD